MSNTGYEEVFKPYSGSMDFSSILSHITSQKNASDEIAEKALNGGICEEDAKEIILLMNKAATSLKATVAVFTEMHKDVSPKEKKTLSDAIERLEGMSSRFKVINQLK